MRPKSEFSKNVLTVMSGTVVAQALTIAIAPILTRLYSPDDFGIFYLFASLATILVIPSTGRYELAILVPESEKSSINITGVALSLCLLFSLFLLAIVWLFNAPICNLLGEPQMGIYLYWIPLSVLTQGGLQTFNIWHNRQKRFRHLTTNKVLIAGSNAGVRIGLGKLQWGTLGLILGTIASQALGFGTHIYRFLRQDRKQLQLLSRLELKSQMKQYAHFPRNMIPAGLSNVGSHQLPPILLNSLFSSSIAGFYGFMSRIIKTPVAVIGKSFEEVFKQKVSEEYQQFGHCRSIFYQTLKRLILLSAIPFAILFFIAPPLFSFVFGEEWRVAGEYAQIFTFPFFLQFVVSPLASILYISENTRWYSISQFVQFSLVLLAFMVGYLIFADAKSLIYCLAIAYSLSYAFLFYLLWKEVKK